MTGEPVIRVWREGWWAWWAELWIEWPPDGSPRSPFVLRDHTRPEPVEGYEQKGLALASTKWSASRKARKMLARWERGEHPEDGPQPVAEVLS